MNSRSPGVADHGHDVCGDGGTGLAGDERSAWGDVRTWSDDIRGRTLRVL